jgi:uncharacterized protein YraI
MKLKTFLGGSFVGILLATTAIAGTSATAITDLHMRAGPGPMHGVVSVIPAGATVAVDGCLGTSNWCRVSRDGTHGWAYGAYLNTEVNDVAMPIVAPEVRPKIRIIQRTERKEPGGTTAAGGAVGAIAGAIIGGPPGALVGAAAGLGLGAIAEPTTREITYVQQNPVRPVYLSGEVVTGAVLPDSVVLTPVPDSAFTYAYVNHVPVIVEPEARRIVYVLR